jgi:hypothetical protein
METTHIVLSSIAVVISIVALVLGYKSNKCANELASIANTLFKTANELASVANTFSKTANDLQSGQIEIQIREMISNARNRYEDIIIKSYDFTDGRLDGIEQSALEGVCNAYDEAWGLFRKVCKPHTGC